MLPDNSDDFVSVSSPSSKEMFYHEAWMTTRLSAFSIPNFSSPAAIRSISMMNIRTSCVSMLKRKQDLEIIYSKFHTEHVTTQEGWNPWHCLRSHWNRIKRITSSSYKEELNVASSWWARTWNVFIWNNKAVITTNKNNNNKMKGKIATLSSGHHLSQMTKTNIARNETYQQHEPMMWGTEGYLTSMGFSPKI